MKESFLKSIKYLYPEGLHGAPAQHRDVIRVYAMGWLDALLATDSRDAARKWFTEYEYISEGDWWPDVSWRWWS